MSITREARHLAGHDIGKTISHHKDIGAGYSEYITGTLWGLTHHALGNNHITILFLDIGPDPTGASRILYLKPEDHVTITGTPSPTCDHDGGQGLGAGHTCRCVRATGHPLDSDRPHGCSCMALWGDTARSGHRQGHTADIAYIDEIHETSNP